MTGRPDNFLPNLPPGLDEVDLLAWIEGDSLPRNREVAVARLLSEHPTLARRLDAMRCDREALRAMPADERAPAGLLANVQVALQPLMERQMLLGLQDDGANEQQVPVSLVVPARRSVWDLLGGSTGRKFAMAAGFLLLVGGTTYLTTSMIMRSGTGGPGPGPVAIYDGGESFGALMHDGVPADEGMSIASADGARASGAPGSGDLTFSDEDLGEAGTSRMAMAPMEANDDPAGDGLGDDGFAIATLPEGDEAGEAGTAIAEAGGAMSMERALQLAQENRLVIRVRVAEGQTQREGADRVANRLRRTGAGWRFAGDAPQVLASAVAPSTNGFDVRRPRPVPDVMAGADIRLPHGALYGPPAPGAMIELPPLRASVYVVQSRLDSTSLESLKTALSGVAADVVLEEADVPLPDYEAHEHSLAPTAVLWWGQSPSAWTWWTSVPVVVEPRR